MKLKEKLKYFSIIIVDVHVNGRIGRNNVSTIPKKEKEPKILPKEEKIPTGELF